MPDQLSLGIKGLTRSLSTLSITSSATPAINTDTYDAVAIGPLAVAITSMTSGLTGTPTDLQNLTIAFLDNGTPRAIAFGASFEASGTALPTTTVASKRLVTNWVYNAAASKWLLASAVAEA